MEPPPLDQVERVRFVVKIFVDRKHNCNSRLRPALTSITVRPETRSSFHHGLQGILELRLPVAPLIPAEAGTQFFATERRSQNLGPRLRGDERGLGRGATYPDRTAPSFRVILGLDPRIRQAEPVTLPCARIKSGHDLVVGAWRANRGTSAHLSPSLKTGLYCAYPTAWGGLFGSSPNEAVGGDRAGPCPALASESAGLGQGRGSPGRPGMEPVRFRERDGCARPACGSWRHGEDNDPPSRPRDKPG
jgi:hypothetical protein